MANSKVYLGNINIGNAKLGISDVKLYLGDMLVYPLNSNVFIVYDVATYNGTLQTAQNIVVTDESGNTLVENVDYVVTENNGGTNAGTYDLIITLMGQYQGTARTNFVINKANSSLSFAVTDLAVAPGETKQNIVTVNAGDGTVTYISSDPSIVTVDNNGNVSGVSNGDTTVSANISSTNNYNSATTSYNAVCGIIVTSKFNVTDTSSPTRIASGTTDFSAIEIDGVKQSSVTTGYTFSTTGEHTVKYTLTNTSIGGYTFSGCTSLTSIDIPSGVTSIGNYAFGECTSLTSCTIGDGVRNIGESAFRNCSGLTSIDIPNGVTSIDAGTFYYCSGLTSVTIGSGVTSIGMYAFQGCSSLTSIVIPSGVTRIGSYAFAYCSGLTSIVIPDSVTSIGSNVFYYCTSLTSCVIGNGVTSIGNSAFGSCRYLISIDIPSGVTTIGDSAFTYCTSLTSCTIGSGVISISRLAFYNCNGLTSITVNATTPPTLANENVFNNTNNCPIYVPCDSVNAYKAATNWSTYASRIGRIYAEPITNAVVTCDSATYNGVAQTAQNIAVTLSGETLVANTDYTVTSNTGGTNAGNYAVVVGGVGCYSGTSNGTFTIGKVTPTVTAPTANVLTYNSQAQELVNAGSTDYGTLKYSLDGISYSTAIPSGITAGSYTVYYKVEGDSNINDVVASTISCSIAKANSSLSFTVTDLTVGIGETKTNAVTVNVGDGVVTYASNNPSIATVDNNGVVSGVSNGNTTISANISSTSNCNSATTSYNVTCAIAVTAKFNVTDTSNPTRIANDRYISGFNAIEIDGVEQPSVVSAYTFSTTGEHTVKYYLKDTSICENAFYYCRGLTSIVIPDSVTSIGEGAFSECSGLTSVTIGDGVTTIGNLAFMRCYSLASVIIPDSVTSIGEGAFQNCTYLTSCTIGSGVTSIDQSTFWGCRRLTSIDIPNSVTSIGYSAFADCSGLTSVTIGDGVTTIGENAFQFCVSLTSVEIPSGVTSIGGYAFAYCSSLTSVTVEAATPPTLLGLNSFKDTNNCLIYVPCDSVDTYKAAQYWSSYASRMQAIAGSCWDITAKYNVTSTSNTTKILSAITAFTKIEIDGIEQPNVVSAYTFSTKGEHTVRYKLRDITSIGDSAFASCYSLTSCTIGSGVTSIGNSAFGSCRYLISIEIPSGVTSIGNSAFVYCNSLESITIPDSVTSIGSQAFYNCSGLTSCTIGSGVTSIANSAFTYCRSLTSCTIGSGVTSIGVLAFQGCRSLTSIDIPNSVTSIGTSAFGYCSGLTSCTIGSGVTTIGERVFEYCSSFTSIDIPDSVTSIGTSAFYSCSSLTGIDIPDSVTSIGGSAFVGCNSLTSIDIPSGVTSIGNYAFNSCSSLTSITVEPTTPPVVGEYSYIFDDTANCPIYVPTCSLVDTYRAASGWSIYSARICAIDCTTVATTFDVTSTSSPTRIGYSVSGFSEIEIDGIVQPSVVSAYTFSTTGEHTVNYHLSSTKIDNNSFFGCSGLRSCTIGSGVTSIGYGAFAECRSLTSIDIPSGVTSIGNYAFQNCSGLTSCTIDSGVTSIGTSAFTSCSSLTSVTVNATTPPTLGSYAFNSTNNCPIFVPTCSLVQTYRSASGWSSYSSRIGSLDCPPLIATFNVIDTTNPTRIASGTTSFTAIEIDGVVQPSVSTGYTFSTTGEHTVKYYLKDTSIGIHAFHNCNSLTSIDIPDIVTSIGSEAFYNCYNLTSIVCNATTAPTISNTTFSYVKTGGTLTVPIGSTGYDVWMGTGDYYLGKYNWTKVEQ